MQSIHSPSLVRGALFVRACLLGALFGSGASAQNMLTNNSFETGPAFTSFISLNPGSTAMPGWIVTRGQIDLVDGWVAADGSRSLDLNGSPGSGGVAQTFSTTPNRDYMISFFVAGNPGAAPAIKTIWVTVVGQTAGVQFDNTGTSNANMGWKQYLYAFRATGFSSTLEFYSGNPSSFGGPALDNVLVRPADCRADLNYDAYVDDADFVVFAALYDALLCPFFPGCAGDFNSDGFIDDADFVIFVAAYNQLLCA